MKQIIKHKGFHIYEDITNRPYSFRAYQENTEHDCLIPIGDFKYLEDAKNFIKSNFLKDGAA
jgi:hypothetical protein